MTMRRSGPWRAVKDESKLVDYSRQAEQMSRQRAGRRLRIGRLTGVAEKEARKGILRTIHAHNLAAQVAGAYLQTGLLMRNRSGLCRNRQPQLVCIVGGHRRHVRGTVNPKGLRVPIALAVFQEEIELRRKEQVARVPKNLVVEGLFEAAHQGCTSLIFASA